MWGAYAALACGVVAIVGGLVTARAEERDEPLAGGAWVVMSGGEPSWAERGSVPPPSV